MTRLNIATDNDGIDMRNARLDASIARPRLLPFFNNTRCDDFL